MKSIMQTQKECYLTGNTYNLHEHHCIYGNGKRKLSEKYGLKIYLTAELHNMSNKGVHFNKELDLKIKQDAQKAFEKQYPDLNFLEVFGRNYL